MVTWGYKWQRVTVDYRELLRKSRSGSKPKPPADANEQD